MNDTVLRCPNCGTTQAAPGECETCHEADVKWFCPNHTPGRWLDGPVCAECAARPRPEAPRPRPTPPPSRVSRGAPPPRDPSRGAPPPGTRPRDPARELLEALLGGRRRDPSDAEYGREVEPPAGWRAEPPIESRGGAPMPWDRGRAPDVRMPRIPFLGCVGQIIKLVVILVILLALGTCWFFSGGGIVISSADGEGRAVTAVVAGRDAVAKGKDTPSADR